MHWVASTGPPSFEGGKVPVVTWLAPPSLARLQRGRLHSKAESALARENGRPKTRASTGPPSFEGGKPTTRRSCCATNCFNGAAFIRRRKGVLGRARAVPVVPCFNG